MKEKLQMIDECIDELEEDAIILDTRYRTTKNYKAISLLKEYRAVCAFEKNKWRKMKDVLIGVHYVDVSPQRSTDRRES